MIVVSDTGPLNYLLLIEAVEILPSLYGAIVIPETVRQEMTHPNAPESVFQWAMQPPEWVSAHQPQTLLSLGLDPGEQAAISLAVEMGADLILMDERRGRREAQAQGLAVTGTLGVLAAAAQAGLIDMADAITRLSRTRFRASPALISALSAQFRAE